MEHVMKKSWFRSGLCWASEFVIEIRTEEVNAEEMW